MFPSDRDVEASVSQGIARLVNVEERQDNLHGFRYWTIGRAETHEVQSWEENLPGKLRVGYYGPPYKSLASVNTLQARQLVLE